MLLQDQIQQVSPAARGTTVFVREEPQICPVPLGGGCNMTPCRKRSQIFLLFNIILPKYQSNTLLPAGFYQLQLHRLQWDIWSIRAATTWHKMYFWFSALYLAFSLQTMTPRVSVWPGYGVRNRDLAVCQWFIVSNDGYNAFRAMWEASFTRGRPSRLGRNGRKLEQWRDRMKRKWRPLRNAGRGCVQLNWKPGLHSHTHTYR